MYYGNGNGVLNTLRLIMELTALVGTGVKWYYDTKQTTAKTSATGNSQANNPDDPDNPGYFNTMNDATSNATISSNNVTDPYYKQDSRQDSTQNSDQQSTWSTAKNILNTLTYAAGIGIPAVDLVSRLLGKNGSSNTNKNNNNNTVKPNIESDVDVENEADFTPNSFNNFVPAINIHTTDDKYTRPIIEINPKPAVFVPYERGYKSIPKTNTDLPRIEYSTEWLFKNQRSPGFCNI